MSHRAMMIESGTAAERGPGDRDLQERLQRLTVMLGVSEIASFVAHELSQPLGAMQLHATACARWLAQTPPSLEEAKAAAERTLRDGSRVREEMQALRSLIPACDPDVTGVELNDRIRDAVRLLRESGKAREVELRLDLGTLPEIPCDPLQVTYVLSCLLENAAEAMADTPLPHVLAIRSCQDPVEGTVVSISDTGTGISADDAESLFTPLFTTKSGGLGLSLATSRRIIELHGGRIWADSNKDRGATFSFSLPAHAG